SNVLGVFGLSRDTDERQLDSIFGDFGQLEKCIIIHDRQNGRSRGFGFVTFVSDEDAQRAREKLNGARIDGRNVRVDFSVTKRAHTP
ncbi:uncharacterized protein MONBRDRAFT_3477, partial [Monosiga brevicollis MX1]